MWMASLVSGRTASHQSLKSWYVDFMARSSLSYPALQRLPPQRRHRAEQPGGPAEQDQEGHLPGPKEAGRQHGGKERSPPPGVEELIPRPQAAARQQAADHPLEQPFHVKRPADAARRR